MSTDSETSSQSVDRDSGSKRSTNEEVDGTGVDRISDLPESLLLHILSFLSVIFVVRTSVLSRRWKNLWTCVPCLRFGSEPGERSENFVNKVLLQYTATSIRKFKLGYGLQDFSAMESWIRWALDRNVEELNLSLHWWISNLEPYPHHLPETIFGCKTLVVLTLKNLDVRMAFPPSACIPCLKTLELDSLRYEDDEFESKLISCCVVLENLSIRKDACGYLDDIRIHLQQLKRLKIGIYQEREYGYNGAQYVIDINAPNLQDLDIEDDGLCSPLLANVGILSKAKINLNCSNAFRSILKCFSAFKIVKSLHLSSSYVRQTCILKPGFTVHNVNLTRLTIGARSVWVQLLPYFFHCFPNLEVLTLTEEKSACKHARKLRTHLKLLPTGLLSRLRVFVAHEFWGTNNEIGMLKYIMKNSQVLDSVGLHYITDPRGTTKMLHVAQTILNFQKTSQKCRIKFF